MDIKFPSSSAPGPKPQEGGGRLINAFTEKTLVGAPSDLIIKRSPGLERVGITNDFVHTRGFLDVGSFVLWAVDARMLKFDENFAVTDLGVFSGTDLVTFARNNANPEQNVVVSSAGAFQLDENSGAGAYGEPDLPANPTSVCDYNGYFVFSYGDGRIFASDLNTYDVNALSFNTEQGLFVRRVVRYAGRLYAFGDKWTGVYRDAGTSPFPFAREVTIPRGIASTHAVAGWEAGWANELLWAGDDYIVYKLNGYTPIPVSTDDVSRDIQECVLDDEGHSLHAFVYMYERNAFWVLRCPGMWTWEYNLASGEWNERLSYQMVDWKGCQSVRAFNHWIIGDGYSGELYRISGTYFRDGLDPLIWQVESGVVAGFPRGMVIPRASFHMTSGVGTFEISEDPLVEISWSLDGGHSFGNPVLRRLGGPGETKSHPYILNTGLSKGQGVRFRLRVSDPVHVGLSGGAIEAEQRGFSG